MDREFTERASVARKTVDTLGTFLDEVSRGTSTYKSVHNLTEQIEHQYAGRFAIELIQNAHDPIRPEPDWFRGERRIELTLEPTGPFGTLTDPPIPKLMGWAEL